MDKFESSSSPDGSSGNGGGGGGVSTGKERSQYVTSQESDPVYDIDSYQTSTTKLLISADGSSLTIANAMAYHDQTKLKNIGIKFIKNMAMMQHRQMKMKIKSKNHLIHLNFLA
mmetsp:Transcript_10988/g.12733  ORF Transcript_10988/g.12733 Transcript_10988/m.12733 type:complete len:114 (+) Transcript_10988:1327-1668(+)